MSKPACAECNHVHASNDGRAVGIFRPEGPRGFMANHPGGALHATRAAAEREVCERRQAVQA